MMRWGTCWSGMSGVASSVSRVSGRVLVIASAACQGAVARVLQRLGMECAPSDNPYEAMIELLRRPLVYQAVVISVQSVYREELSVISTIKRRLPHLEVWLTQTDGRHAALAEGMRLGADALLEDDGLHRTAGADKPVVAQAPPDLLAADHAEITESSGNEPQPITSMIDEPGATEPVLSAEELRALLQETPVTPPVDEE